MEKPQERRTTDMNARSRPSVCYPEFRFGPMAVMALKRHKRTTDFVSSTIYLLPGTEEFLIR